LIGISRSGNCLLKPTKICQPGCPGPLYTTDACDSTKTLKTPLPRSMTDTKSQGDAVGVIVEVAGRGTTPKLTAGLPVSRP